MSAHFVFLFIICFSSMSQGQHNIMLKLSFLHLFSLKLFKNYLKRVLNVHSTSYLVMQLQKIWNRGIKDGKSQVISLKVRDDKLLKITCFLFFFSWKALTVRKWWTDGRPLLCFASQKGVHFPSIFSTGLPSMTPSQNYQRPFSIFFSK